MKAFSLGLLAVVGLLAACASVPKQSGYVVVECTALRSGEIRDCEAVEVQPAGTSYPAQHAIEAISRGNLQADPQRPEEGVKFRTTVRFRED